MDRFIEVMKSLILKIIRNLKSNMDRFIVVIQRTEYYDEFEFKIQYG